jgi:Flp pilus assembly protein TadG
MIRRIVNLKARGSSLVETVCGCILLVAIGLFLVDVSAVVICQTQNDALAKHCARAAAAQDNVTVPGSAQAAVDAVIAKFQTENGASKVCIYNSNFLNWQPANATATVVTTVTCNFPVPVPFGPAYMQFKADATEPIVAVLP